MAKYTSQFNNLLYDLYLYATHRPLCKFLDFFFAEQLLSGNSLGPDPNDVPPVIPQGVTSQVANITECETIEEEDSSEYEESSDEQEW